MTDFELRWSPDSIKEYVSMNVRGKDGTSSLPLILCLVCFGLMAVFSIVIYFMMKLPAALVLGGVAVVFAVGLFIGLNILVNSLTGKLIKANEENKGLICSVNDSSLIISRDNVPVNITDWSAVNNVAAGKTAYFVTTKDNMLFILERNAVVSGELSEAERILTGHMDIKQ